MVKKYWQTAVICAVFATQAPIQAMKTREAATLNELEYAMYINYSSVEALERSIAVLLRPRVIRARITPQQLANFINHEVEHGEAIASLVVIEAFTRNNIASRIAEVFSHVKICQDYLKQEEEENRLRYEIERKHFLEDDDEELKSIQDTIRHS